MVPGVAIGVVPIDIEVRELLHLLAAPNSLGHARLLINRLVLQNPSICRIYVGEDVHSHAAVLLDAREFMRPPKT